MFLAQEVQLIAVDKLLPYARNSRTHSDSQVAAVAASIREFGFTNPILVRADGTIVAGHGRVMAAKKLGLIEVPCIELGHLSDAQMRAYVIADNKLAEQAGWDEDLLKLELLELRDAGFDLGLTGFAEDELAKLALAAGVLGLTDPDDAPEVPRDPTSRLGDLWELGPHRLLCGDSTNGDDVARVLCGVKPHLMVTDPPYGVNYDPAWRERAGVSDSGTAKGVVLNDDRADWRAAWDLFPGDVAYVWHGGLHSSTVAESLAASRFQIRAQIIWVKTRAALSRGHYHWQHEPAFYAQRDGVTDDQWRFVPEHQVAAYAVKQGATASWSGDRRQTTVWFIEHLKNDTGHGTQKPVECMKRPIENNSSPGQAVYEPFCGSGTTLIAAEMTGRVCHALELSPAYVDVIVRRWQEFRGASAVLNGDGRTFADVAAERAAE